MLFNLITKNKRRETAASFLGLLGSGTPPSPGAVFCQLVTRLITHLNTPAARTATITVTKQTTIT